MHALVRAGAHRLTVRQWGIPPLPLIDKKVVNDLGAAILAADAAGQAVCEALDGSVAVPKGPGLGIELDRNRLEKWAAAEPVDKGRFLVRIRSAGGPIAYLRHDPEPLGSTDNLRFHDRLHLNGIPGRPASYANPLTTEFWDAEKDPDNFADIWERTADGPIWREE